jgi:Domain of unknown function (DUF6378)
MVFLQSSIFNRRVIMSFGSSAEVKARPGCRSYQTWTEWKKRKQKETEQDVAPEAPAKKVSPLKGRKLGPRKKPSPLKGRKLGPRKPKPLIVPLGVLEAVQKSKRAQIDEAIKPGIDALFGMEYKKTVQEPSVNTLLQERALQYGTFASLAKTAQEFKSVLYRELGSRNKRLADDQAEALDMIMTKIARVINGDADHADSWADIAGYATLVAERLQGRTL